MASTAIDERNSVFSYQMALLSFGGFAGAWFGGFSTAFLSNRFSLSLDAPYAYAWTMSLASCVLLLGIWAAFTMRPVHRVMPDRTQLSSHVGRFTETPFPLQAILLIATVVTLRIVGEQSVRIFVNLYLDSEFGVRPSRIAYIYSTAQLLSVPAPLMAPFLMQRFGRGHVFNWATVVVAMCVLATAMAPNWIMVAISYVFLLAFAQVARPAISIISMESVEPKWHASMSSSNLIAIGLSGLLTSTLGGLMMGTVGFRPFFLTAAVVTLAGVVVFWAGFLRENSSETAQA